MIRGGIIPSFFVHNQQLNKFSLYNSTKLDIFQLCLSKPIDNWSKSNYNSNCKMTKAKLTPPQGGVKKYLAKDNM